MMEAEKFGWRRSTLHCEATGPSSPSHQREIALPIVLPSYFVSSFQTFLETTTLAQLHKFAHPTSFCAKLLLQTLGLVYFQIASPTWVLCEGHTLAMLTRTMALRAFFNPASRLFVSLFFVTWVRKHSVLTLLTLPTLQTITIAIILVAGFLSFSSLLLLFLSLLLLSPFLSIALVGKNC